MAKRGWKPLSLQRTHSKAYYSGLILINNSVKISPHICIACHSVPNTSLSLSPSATRKGSAVLQYKWATREVKWLCPMLTEMEDARSPRGSGVQPASCADEEPVARERKWPAQVTVSKYDLSLTPNPRSSDVKRVSFYPILLCYV